MDKEPSMIKAALWYARMGFHIFPLHEPTFENGENGCTCEEWKRGEGYKEWLESQGRADEFDPSYVCPNKGKHPVGSDDNGTFGHAMATTNQHQIRKWWGRRPTANIGWVPGLSGHIVLDADTYKDEYGGDEILDTETVTQLTGGGGEHYIYEKRDGQTYSNATGALPPGIDVRADGGYVVVAPSVHESGNRYVYEEGYGWNDLKPLPLPRHIHDALTTAQYNGDVGPADSVAVERSMSLIERVMDGQAYTVREKADGGRVFVVRDCPFNPADDPHATDQAAFIRVHSDGRIGAGCHHARCQEEIKERGLSGWALVKERMGYKPPRLEPAPMQEPPMPPLEEPAPRLPIVPMWEIKSALDAMASYIPTEWIVEDIFEKSGLFVVYGQPGGHKSNIMFDMGMAIASGKNFLPSSDGRMQGFEVDQGPIYWLDCDNGSKRMHNRLHAFGNGYFNGIEPSKLPFVYTSMPKPHLDAGHPDAAHMLSENILRVKPRLVVIDNLGLVKGDIEESSADMARVMNTFRQVAEDTDVSIALIHHERKGAANGTGRKGENIRGSSTIEASLDAAFAVTVEAENKNMVSFKPTKTRGYAISGFKSEWLYRHYPDTKDLERARFYARRGAAMSDNDYARFLVTTALHNITIRGKENLVQEAQKVAARTKGETRKVSDYKIRTEITKMEDENDVKWEKADDTSNAHVYGPM